MKILLALALSACTIPTPLDECHDSADTAECISDSAAAIENAGEVACSEADKDADGHYDVLCGGDDCDDANPNIHPGAEEICIPATLDDDCDGTVDEGCTWPG